MKSVSLWAIAFWVFVAIKLAGTSLAGWSWWWVLLPMIPDLSMLVKRFAL